jgi:sugar lactone lactonase YvrE
MSRLAYAALPALLACTALLTNGTPPPLQEPAWFHMPSANRGDEAYSAWFADTRGPILYFGLSAFWSTSWAAGGDPHADLSEPGDWLIGRFDMDSRRFLEPLRVGGEGERSSVWDVLAHSNGRIYFTTYFEAIGSVAADGSDPREFSGVGNGLNELYEGPDGRVYVTRYATSTGSAGAGQRGGVLVLEPDGSVVRELQLADSPDGPAAAKSLAVDPRSGEIWLNTDTFLADGSLAHETVRLAADGTELSRHSGDPELLFVRFDARGRGWFAEREAGALRVRMVDGERALERELGALPAIDFVQDIQFAADGRVALARWSGVVHVLSDRGAELEHVELSADGPRPCPVTGGPPLLYSAIPFGSSVFATVYCGGAIVELPLEQ